MKFIKGFGRSTLIGACLLTAGAASAMPIMLPSGLSVNGSIEYDEASSFIVDATQEDIFGIGADASFVDNGTVTGSNPISGNVNDVLFVSSALNGVDTEIDFDYARYDFDVTIDNMLAAAVDIVFSFEYSMFAFAEVEDVTVDDAIADALFSIDDMGGNIFEASVTSNLNQAPETDDGTFEFTMSVASGDSLAFSGFFESTVFSTGTSFVDSINFANLSILDVTVNEPIAASTPATASLLILSALGLLRLRRKHANAR